VNEAHQVQLRFLAEPGSVNYGGKVHGGSVMKWIDEAGYACAVAWAKRYCVTAYVGGIQFLRPIRVGSLVEVTATLALTGATSMSIEVSVAAADPKEGVFRKTTDCLIVFVAVNDAGEPASVAPWVPQGDLQCARQQRAQQHRLLRQQLSAGAS
jgi:acyl-CoA hydrolase